MNLKELLAENKIEPVEKEEFSTESAEKDINSAKNSLNSEDYDWALSIAYNAVLRVARGLMFYKGYRPIGKEHHKHTFEFLRCTGFDVQLTDYFDSIRRKRNKFIYGIVEGTTAGNAAEAIKKAEEFVQKIRTFVQKIRTEKSG